MPRYDLSVIVPGIRTEAWVNFFTQLRNSVGKYTFELIIVGPNLPPPELQVFKNFRFIRDFGHPSRCFQLAAQFAEGHFLCFIPDDAIIEEKALELCLDVMYQKSMGDGMTLKYSEGFNYTGNQHEDDTYWVGRTHPDQRAPAVKEGWKIAPCFLYNTHTFINMGGLDCRFEHINFNTHDFAYRLQAMGGTMHYSPTRVFKANHIPSGSQIAAAHWENDSPLFTKLYSGPDNYERIFIDYNNWRNADSFWKRKYGG
jgi:hypothetical protein